MIKRTQSSSAPPITAAMIRVIFLYCSLFMPPTRLLFRPVTFTGVVSMANLSKLIALLRHRNAAGQLLGEIRRPPRPWRGRPAGAAWAGRREPRSPWRRGPRPLAAGRLLPRIGRRGRLRGLPRHRQGVAVLSRGEAGEWAAGVPPGACPGGNSPFTRAAGNHGPLAPCRIVSLGSRRPLATIVLICWLDSGPISAAAIWQNHWPAMTGPSSYGIVIAVPSPAPETGAMVGSPNRVSALLDKPAVAPWHLRVPFLFF